MLAGYFQTSYNLNVKLTACSVIRLPSATMGAVPLVQVKLSEEPFAEQLRTTVLLNSIAAARLDVMTTSDTGSAGETRAGRFAIVQINKEG